MNTKQLQLVISKQAKRLKAVGFDWETTDYFRYWYNEIQLKGDPDQPNNYNKRIKTVNPDEDFYSAPTVSLALKWFRDVKGMSYTIESHGIDKGYSTYAPDNAINAGWYKTYEEVESALLDELLNLIEKEK